MDNFWLNLLLTDFASQKVLSIFRELKDVWVERSRPALQFLGL